MKVGFIGLGRMGQAMAGRLLGAGHDLLVYNRTAAKAAALGEAGAEIAESVGAVTRDRDVVITMLTDDAALQAVAHGDGGLIGSLAGDTIHLAMGTHGIDMTRALAAAHEAAGQRFVAAPVLGRPDRAQAGELCVVAGGPADLVEECRPLFEIIGRRTFEAGSKPEAAAAIKITNNFVLVCAIEAMGEAFSLVRKFGVPASTFYEVLTDGLFAAPAYTVYGDLIVKEAYDQVGVTATIGLKDINLALSAGDAVDVTLPFAGAVRGQLEDALAHGEGELDWSVIARVQARASGLE